MVPQALRPWLLFASLALMWGSSYLFIKIGLESGLPPLTLIAERLWIAVVALVVLFRVTGGRLPREPRTLLRIAVLAPLNIVLPFILITWGELWIPSAMASILNGLVPLFTIVIAGLVLQDEPITLNRVLGLLVGFGGAAVIVAPDVLGGPAGGDGAMLLLGELAIVGSSLLYAFAGVYARAALSSRDLVEEPGGARRAPSPIEIALIQGALAALLVTPLALVLEPAPAGGLILPRLPDGLFAVVWLGLFGSALAYLLYFRLLRAWGATRTATLAYVFPVLGTVLGVLVLDERLDASAIAGAALVVLGIALVNTRRLAWQLYGRAPRAAAGHPSGVEVEGAAGCEGCLDEVEEAAATRPAERKQSGTVGA